MIPDFACREANPLLHYLSCKSSAPFQLAVSTSSELYTCRNGLLGTKSFYKQAWSWAFEVAFVFDEDVATSRSE